MGWGLAAWEGGAGLPPAPLPGEGMGPSSAVAAPSPLTSNHRGEQAVWEGESSAMTSGLRTLVTEVDPGDECWSLRFKRHPANRGAVPHKC